MERDLPSTERLSRKFILSQLSSASQEDLEQATHSHRHRKSHRHTSKSTFSDLDLTRLLLDKERDLSRLQGLLNVAHDQLDHETQRAIDAESRVTSFAQRFRAMHEARLAALQDLGRASEELRLYKVSYEYAQREIIRAQEVINDVEASRLDAEDEAARCRGKIRKMREERLVSDAREEGWREGVREGMERGREEGYQEGLKAGYANGQEDANMRLERALERVMDVPQAEEYASEAGDDVQGQQGIMMHDVRSGVPRTRTDDTAPSGSVRTPSPTPLPIPFHPHSPIPQTSVPSVPGRSYPPPRTESQGSESAGTTISQFELVSFPAGIRGRHAPRRTMLSAIPEVSTPSSSALREDQPVFSRTPSVGRIAEDMDSNSSISSSTPPSPKQPSPQRSHSAYIADLEDRARAQDREHEHGHDADLMYHRPRTNSTDSQHSHSGRAHTKTSIQPQLTVEDSPASSVPEITIQPPSRPASNSSRISVSSGTRQSLLSPDHANRPLDQLPVTTPPEFATRTQITTPPAIFAEPPLVDMPSSSGIIYRIVEELPPGFVPTANVTPASPFFAETNNLGHGLTPAVAAAIPLPGSVASTYSPLPT